MSKLKDTLSQRWFTTQTSLFPWLSEELGELTDKQQELVTTLEMIRIEEFILSRLALYLFACHHFLHLSRQQAPCTGQSGLKVVEIII